MTQDQTAQAKSQTRQKRVGDALRRETRNRILEAAEVEFTAGGYAGTTVNRLAASAGVSVQTLYLAWGSKRALLRGYMEHVLAGDAASPADAATRFVGMLPRERLTELGSLVAEIAGRAATGWSLYRDAAAVDAEIAEDWNELQLLRRQLIARVFEDIPPSAIANGLTLEDAIDTAWVIASPESYDLLVRRQGYSLDHFREWMQNTLSASLLRSRASHDA
jgi:AcrR family transcriptional regulator